MLLQPRKFTFKKRQKKRIFKNFKIRQLSYGNIGLKILSILKISGKQIFRLKIFLKRSIRKSEITRRFFWFSAFPHTPLTKKAKGVRMGKGAGKLSFWYIQLSAGINLVEFRNLRPGRAKYYMRQLSFKVSVKTTVIQQQTLRLKLNTLRHINPTQIPFR